jgi:hypothetical protein
MDSDRDDVGIEFSEIVGIKTGQVPSEEEESRARSVERLVTSLTSVWNEGDEGIANPGNDDIERVRRDERSDDGQHNGVPREKRLYTHISKIRGRRS